jgi:hypothetical protein
MRNKTRKKKDITKTSRPFCNAKHIEGFTANPMSKLYETPNK